MTKYCSICNTAFKDGDAIVAAMITVYHDIPSKTTYAIEQPTGCWDMQHEDCWEGER